MRCAGFKSSVPPRVRDRCCISGVRGAGVVEPRSGAIETSIDRFGGDYRNFELKSERRRRDLQGSLRRRQQMPRLDLRAAGLCRASDAHCFLKKEIKPPRRKAGFTVGRGAVVLLVPAKAGTHTPSGLSIARWS